MRFYLFHPLQFSKPQLMCLLDAAVGELDKGKHFQNNHENIPIQERLELVKLVLNTKVSIKDQTGNSRQRIIVALDMAKFCKIAMSTFHIRLPSLEAHHSSISKNKCSTRNIVTSGSYRYCLLDPRVALWMLQEGEDENTMEYFLENTKACIVWSCKMLYHLHTHRT